MDVFKTIAASSEGYYIEQRSKFLSFAIPVHTLEQVKKSIDVRCKKYYDAQHICWAYVLGVERKLFRSNDDGEPSSTAGKPILGVIYSNELTNIIIIVVRYFGGIKLGISGLIAAYRTAAQHAIMTTQIIERTVDEHIHIAFEYPFLNSVMKIIKDIQPRIIAQHFDADCKMTLLIRQGKAEKLRNQFLRVKSVRILKEPFISAPNCLPK